MKSYEYSPRLNGNLYESKNTKLANRLTSIFLLVLMIFACSILCITTIYSTAEVEGQSMYPTINSESGAQNEIAYYTTFKTPQKGDIVIVDYNHSVGLNLDAIKRLIATGGDTICYYNQQILVNGKAIDETYMQEAYNLLEKEKGTDYAKQWLKNGFNVSKNNFENWCKSVVNGNYSYKTTFAKNYATDYEGAIQFSETLNTYVLTIPKGFSFVLGDNRANSTDSSQVGPIESKYILVKVDYIAPSGRSIVQQLWIEFLKKFK
jgi:signal peptidase I